MADRLDVAERLAEGLPAVEHTQTYVRAWHAVGFGDPDLTAHPAQVRDWYDTEDGLDLRALDRDCAELRAAGEVVAEAMRVQQAQVAELAGAWTGPGGEAAVRFLERHCDAGAMVATELRAAAQRCESLRDNLWYLVDSKVATAVAVDERTRARREEWLAAAAAVTTGVGDLPAAEEVVRQQIAPYVDEDIRHDWLTTMRSTVAGVATSYDMVIDRMAAAPAPSFEFPGDLRLSGQPLPAPSAPASPVPVAPAAVSGPPVDPPAVDPPAPPMATAAPAAAPMPDWGTALGDVMGTPAGDMGGGVGSLGGLAGLAGRIVDAMSGLLGSATDQFGGEDAVDGDPFDPDQGDPFRPEDRNDGPDDELKEADSRKGMEPVAAPPPGDAPPVDAPAPVDAPPAPPPPPPAPDDAPPEPPAPDGAPPIAGAQPPDEAKTPCEIAADQLPQAGQ